MLILPVLSLIVSLLSRIALPTAPVHVTLPPRHHRRPAACRQQPPDSFPPHEHHPPPIRPPNLGRYAAHTAAALPPVPPGPYPRS
jgi:hypothetical protein